MERTVYSSIAKLLNQPFGLTGDAYDTAWVAILLDENHQAYFPESFKRLAQMQHDDGSWGSSVPYVHDRILSTLAALITIVTIDPGINKDIIEKGTQYLWKNEQFLKYESIVPVGFELLFPTLVERAIQAGIQLPISFQHIYRKERSEKLSLIPSKILYSPKITLCHSLEFLHNDVDVNQLEKAQGSNGSIGNSPAATAYFFQLTRNPKAFTYLKNLADRNAAIPVLYPCDTFEYLWGVYHLYLAQVPVSQLLPTKWQKQLAQELEDAGVSLSPTFPIPDADDTAVALLLLDELNIQCKPEILEKFALPTGYYASFPYERHPSVGVNLHVLHTILHFQNYPNRDEIITKLVDFIISNQTDDYFWTDKWHISPLYATSHALNILAQLPAKWLEKIKPNLQRAKEWVRQTQNKDGSWGFYGIPTAEETAFAILGLISDHQKLDNQDIEVCNNAYSYFKKTKDENKIPPLWLDKCLYSSPFVSNAIIESALILLRRTIQND